MTLETASGTLVPAAKNVMPITESEMFNVSPVKIGSILFSFSLFASLVEWATNELKKMYAETSTLLVATFLSFRSLANIDGSFTNDSNHPGNNIR